MWRRSPIWAKQYYASIEVHCMLGKETEWVRARSHRISDHGLVH